MVSRDKESLSEARMDFLRKNYTSRQVAYITAVFDEGDLFDIENTPGAIPEEDFFIIARATRIVKKRPWLAKRFDSSDLLDRHHYHELAEGWLAYEERLLELQYHRRPTGTEVAKDFTEHKNGQRFRVFYCLKFPDKVKIRKG